MWSASISVDSALMGFHSILKMFKKKVLPVADMERMISLPSFLKQYTVGTVYIAICA